MNDHINLNLGCWPSCCQCTLLPPSFPLHQPQAAMHIDRVESGAATVLSSMAPSFAACDDLRHCRSVASIIFSCASTMFLCTWVALHPDVPENPRKPCWKRLFERFGWMGLAILAPEGLLTWALYQWMNSCIELVNLLSEFEELVR